MASEDVTLRLGLDSSDIQRDAANAASQLENEFKNIDLDPGIADGLAKAIRNIGGEIDNASSKTFDLKSSFDEASISAQSIGAAFEGIDFNKSFSLDVGEAEQSINKFANVTKEKLSEVRRDLQDAFTVPPSALQDLAKNLGPVELLISTETR